MSYQLTQTTGPTDYATLLRQKDAHILALQKRCAQQEEELWGLRAQVKGYQDRMAARQTIERDMLELQAKVEMYERDLRALRTQGNSSSSGNNYLPPSSSGATNGGAQCHECGEMYQNFLQHAQICRGKGASKQDNKGGGQQCEHCGEVVTGFFADHNRECRRRKTVFVAGLAGGGSHLKRGRDDSLTESKRCIHCHEVVVGTYMEHTNVCRATAHIPTAQSSSPYMRTLPQELPFALSSAPEEIVSTTWQKYGQTPVIYSVDFFPERKEVIVLYQDTKMEKDLFIRLVKELSSMFGNYRIMMKRKESVIPAVTQSIPFAVPAAPEEIVLTIWQTYGQTPVIRNIEFFHERKEVGILYATDQRLGKDEFIRLMKELSMAFGNYRVNLNWEGKQKPLMKDEL